jgi:hypothetical protein
VRGRPRAARGAPDTGVNALTGEGLAEALEGVQIVVDVANAPVWEDAAVMDFFQTSSRNILAAEAAADGLRVVERPRLTRRPWPRATICIRRLRPWTTAIAFPWKLPGDRPHRAGDGPRPVRAGSGLALGF